MQIDKKYFVSNDSLLDSDSADFAVSQNAWVNMENFRTGTTDINGVIGTVESISGTKQIENPNESEYEYIAVGSVSDQEGGRFITFYWDKSGSGMDKIECTYINTNTIYPVILPSQIVYDNSGQLLFGLNFSGEPIHSAKIIGNILSWTEGKSNEPRKININKAMRAQSFFPDSVFDEIPYTFPLSTWDITVIKKPPIYPPQIEKVYDSSFENNLIEFQSFQFAYQYVYYDYEKTVTGVYSPSTRLNYESQNYNCINVVMGRNEAIPITVKQVNLIVRVGDGTNTGTTTAQVIKTWNRTEIDQQLLYNVQYKFYNTISGEVVPTDDVLRPFDNVPIYSKTHEIAKYRYFFANNTEGYDTPQSTSLSVSLGQTVNAGATTIQGYLLVASIYGNGFPDGYSYYNAFCIYANISGNPGYYEVLNPSPFFTYYPGGSPSTITISNIPTTLNVTDLRFRGFSERAFFDSIEADYSTLLPVGINNLGQPMEFISNTLYSVTTGDIPITGVSPSYTYNIFPQLSPYKFGVVFYDYAMRKCGVVESNSNISTPSRNFNWDQAYSTFNWQFSLPQEFLSSSDWTTGIGWSGSFSSGFSHSIGNTDILTNSLPSTIGVNYNIIVTVQNRTTGSIKIDFGGTSTFGINTTVSLNTIAISNQNLIIIPDIDFDGTIFLSILNTSNQSNEIPKWAYYYSIVRTLNLRTRFFVQGISSASKCKYVTRNSSGQYIYVDNVYNTTSQYGVAIDISSLSQSGLGYQFSEGDICAITRYDNVKYNIPVIGQDGSYVILKLTDIGNFGDSTKKYIFELYTPYKKSTQEPYYEIGLIYSISRPGTPFRAYNPNGMSGSFIGDSYLNFRSVVDGTYYASAMSPNDVYYKRWDSDAGKPNFITQLGQVDNITAICWSDVVTTGTKINGSSTFRLGNRVFLSDECGAINKLIFTSKVQDAGQGMIMLAISVNETSSMYLGETQILDNTGATQFFSGSTNVIGTINTLKGSFGTINPEAVVEFRGQVFYPDANKGVWVQYSSNGLFPISNYKTTRFWKSFFKQYLSMTKEQIELIGGRPYIFTAVDNSHLELLISIPKLLQDPPKGYLPDYQEIPYPFDMWDGQGKTVVFCLDNQTQQSHWQGAYTFNPELFTTIGNSLYGYKNGNLWQHNISGNYGTFYGEYHPSRIMFISNIFPQVPKIYNNIKIHANQKPSLTYFYNDFPYLQISDLLEDDYRDFEGIYYASLYRNKMIPLGESHGIMQYSQDGLLTFEKMRNVAMKTMLEFSPSKNFVEVKFAEIGYDPSSNLPSS